MTYCPQCGYALREGVLICPSCGIKTVESFGKKQEQTVQSPAQTAVYPKITADAPISDILKQAEEEKLVPEEEFPIPEPLAEREVAPVKTSYGDNVLPTGKYALLSTWGYLINQILFLIPGIGFIAAIIMACAAKKVNRRRHALSVVILYIIGILLAGAGVGAVMLLGIENIPFLSRILIK